jgi:hypothetical protein
MEVNGQFHVPLALSSVPIEKEPRWASESVWPLCKTEFFFTLHFCWALYIFSSLFYFLQSVITLFLNFCSGSELILNYSWQSVPYRPSKNRNKKILWTQNSTYWGRLFSFKFLHCVSFSKVNFPFVGGKFILISFSILQTRCTSLWGQINMRCLRVRSLFRENIWWSITNILET